MNFLILDMMMQKNRNFNFLTTFEELEGELF